MAMEFTPREWSLDIGGRTLKIGTGMLAGQASGAVTVQYGDTVVLGTACMSKGMSSRISYFPLMVDFEERYYAAGKIKGSRFIKREGRPSDAAVLAGRAVDRTVRPLFNSRMRNEVQVVCTALSYDGENDVDQTGMIAASAALSISDIAWNGPIAAVRVGLEDGKFVLNPTTAQRAVGKLDLLVSGTATKINMIECGSYEIPEDQMVEAIRFAHDAIAKIATFIAQIQTEAGKEKSTPALLVGTPEFERDIKQRFMDLGLGAAMYMKPKAAMVARVAEIEDEVTKFAKEVYADQDNLRDVLALIQDEVSDAAMHDYILQNETRPDGRGLTEIRPIWAKVGVLPRTHGTGIFTRGETQVLTVTTLGAPGDQQIIDTMEVEEKKRYMHFYNFPPYSVGEIKPMRGPGRREVGHGALAEKALLPVLPSVEEFPYTILLVSEVLSSNGSSSMASTCGSTLSMMDAGVPLRKPVSGIAMGVITGADGAYKVLTDIQGMEDHYGDMDFKVAGTADGITALQLDVKIDGLTPDMLAKALDQAKVARLEILTKMLAAIPAPRKELSMYAPRITTIKINPDKIRDVIGQGGKTINEIIDTYGVSIDIEQDGTVFITGSDAARTEQAIAIVKSLTREVKAGERFTATITKLMAFGAFAEVLPKQEGLIHISELADHRVERVEDVVNVGDKVEVIVKAIDDQGRINLSMKMAAHHE